MDELKGGGEVVVARGFEPPTSTPPEECKVWYW